MLEKTNLTEVKKYADTLGVKVGSKMTDKQKYDLINEMFWDKFMSKDPNVKTVLDQRLASLSNDSVL